MTEYVHSGRIRSTVKQHQSRRNRICYIDMIDDDNRDIRHKCEFDDTYKEDGEIWYHYYILGTEKINVFDD